MFFFFFFKNNISQHIPKARTEPGHLEKVWISRGLKLPRQASPVPRVWGTPVHEYSPPLEFTHNTRSPSGFGVN